MLGVSIGQIDKLILQLFLNGLRSGLSQLGQDQVGQDNLFNCQLPAAAHA